MSREKTKLIKIDGEDVLNEYHGHLWGNADAGNLRLVSIAHAEEYISMYEASSAHLKLLRIHSQTEHGVVTGPVSRTMRRDKRTQPVLIKKPTKTEREISQLSQ